MERGWVATGDERVDEAVGRLAEIDDRDLHDHIRVYEDIHRMLGSVLETDAPPSDQGR